MRGARALLADEISLTWRTRLDVPFESIRRVQFDIERSRPATLVIVPDQPADVPEVVTSREIRPAASPMPWSPSARPSSPSRTTRAWPEAVRLGRDPASSGLSDAVLGYGQIAENAAS